MTWQPFLADGLLTLTSSALQDGAGSIADMQFGGALLTQPNDDSRSINPIEGAYLLGDLHRVLALQSLQRLHEKHSVVEISVG